MFRYSVFLLFCFLALGCSTQDREYDYGEGLLQSRYIIEKYGQIRGRDQDEYVAYLEGRLTEAIPDRSRAPHYKFILVNSAEPLAFSPGGGFVLFSRGLVTSLSNEAELAFVLAHELAHEYLGHNRVDLDSYSEHEMPQRQRQMEIEADEFAIGLVALAGYDPRLASFSLLKAYRSLPSNESAPEYPDLNSRLDHVRAKIESSGWMPPGTIDRRDFRAFRQTLAKLR